MVLLLSVIKSDKCSFSPISFVLNKGFRCASFSDIVVSLLCSGREWRHISQLCVQSIWDTCCVVVGYLVVVGDEAMLAHIYAVFEAE